MKMKAYLNPRIKNKHHKNSIKQPKRGRIVYYINTHTFQSISITPNKCLAYHYVATNMSEQIKAGVININVPYVCSH